MKLFCPDPKCKNHFPQPFTRWYDYHGTYNSCGTRRQRYRCKHCGKTFSARSLSIDYWTHRQIDYDELITHFISGYSVRGLARYFRTNTETIQNRFSRLSRNFIAVLSLLHHRSILCEDLVADGFESFCYSQDFPNNIHLLVGKESQFLYGFNYALMRRKGRYTKVQKQRCNRLYQHVDFASHTIKKAFKELLIQTTFLVHRPLLLRFYTDDKRQYKIALHEDPYTNQMKVHGIFSHLTVSSRVPRTLTNNLFSANYLDREIRKDLPEHHRETVCFARNVTNCLERLCVYFLHHNFIKKYRIGVTGEERTHAEVAGLNKQDIDRIRRKVTMKRSFYHEGEVSFGGFFDQLWRRAIPTPLKQSCDYLPKFALA